eukprot:364759-Chlamydomonas_euryale.AAC.4
MLVNAAPTSARGPTPRSFKSPLAWRRVSRRRGPALNPNAARAPASSAASSAVANAAPDADVVCGYSARRAGAAGLAALRRASGQASGRGECARVDTRPAGVRG